MPEPTTPQAAPAEAIPAWATQLLVDVAVIRRDLTAVTDHETRIRSLERRAWSLTGISAIAGAGLSQIVSIFTQAPPAS